jgi:hypothetical protein
MAMVESPYNAPFLTFAISLQKKHGYASDYVMTIHVM